MNNKTQKPRKHRWVTEALNEGETFLSVWPSPNELKNSTTKKKFLDTIEKIGNDPRVEDVSKRDHDRYQVVYVFSLSKDK